MSGRSLPKCNDIQQHSRAVLLVFLLLRWYLEKKCCNIGGWNACPSGANASVTVRATWQHWPTWPEFKAQSACVRIIAAYALRLKSQAGTECLTVSSLNCDRWLMLGLEMLLVAAWTTDNIWHLAACTGLLLIALHALLIGPLSPRCEVRESWAIRHAVGISCQRNSGYKAEQGRHWGTSSLHFPLWYLP